jgi:hypothetical protein
MPNACRSIPVTKLVPGMDIVGFGILKSIREERNPSNDGWRYRLECSLESLWWDGKAINVFEPEPAWEEVGPNVWEMVTKAGVYTVEPYRTCWGVWRGTCWGVWRGDDCPAPVVIYRNLESTKAWAERNVRCAW